MNDREEFYTVRGYELRQAHNQISSSMEDYLEMAYRLSQEKGYTRVNDLARALNVQPPSASRMVQKLADAKLMNYEKYGVIELTDNGKEIGKYLLKRHATIEEFLKIIGVTDGILEETEKIEHHLSPQTIDQIYILVQFLKVNTTVLNDLHTFQQKAGGNLEKT
ncbi:MAG: transcriptional regulator MntR [Syntrophomonadaceae bacterium]|jgi:DtxR family Mn-dependent transcriptional regulator